jgi:hypothetical protein
MAIVYQHRRIDSGEIFYIGVGVNKYRAYKKFGRNQHWKNIAQKGYQVEIIFENLTWEKAIEKEKDLILLYGRRDLGLGPLVNMTDGGEGVVGQIRSETSKKRHSEAMIGRLVGEKNPMFGKKNIFRSETNKKQIGENNPRAKSVIQYDLEYNYIAEYKTAKQAQEKTGIIRSGICQVCKGLNKTSGGFIWKYKNSEHESNS